MAHWLEFWTLNYLGSNTVHQTFGKVFHFTLLQITQLDEYLAVDSGGCLCMNSLHTLIAAWQDASLRSQDGVRL